MHEKIITKIEVKLAVLVEKVDQVLVQTTKTNGRVTVTEQNQIELEKQNIKLNAWNKAYLWIIGIILTILGIILSKIF